MIKYIFFLLASVSISFLITPLTRLLAQKLNVLDFPSERKMHETPVPLLGGIPIFLSFNLTLFLGVILNITYLKEFLFSRWQTVLSCQIIILILGIYDDKRKVTPQVKFLFQIIVGTLLVVFGFGIHEISNPFTGSLIQLGFFSIPITILWVVGIINALNLVDGLDGLAAGTSFIVCATIFGISFFNQNIGVAIVSLTLAGSILGFLRYNFYPAKIFLGDSGSLLLGLLLGFLSIEGTSKGATLIAVLAPILALGLPIMDTLLSMIRRFLKSIHLIDYPSENAKLKALFFKGFTMFKADEDHIHHRLLKLGLSQKKAVIVLYTICVILCALAFLTVAWADFNITFFLLAIIISIFIGVKTLNYKELRIFESGLLLPIFNIPLINKKLFQAVLDLFIISLSYVLSFILVSGGFDIPAKTLFIKTLSIVLAIKIIVFYVSGLYKGTWRYSSVEDIIKIIKAVISSSIVTIFFLGIFFGIKAFGGIIFFIIDFYLSFSFAAGSRISYRILDSFYDRNSTSKVKKVIIYGAGYKGSMLLKEIKHNGSLSYLPVGFVDDDHEKKGRIQHGCRILGSLEDLEKIVSENEISEIIISTEKVDKERMERLKEFCKQKGIAIKQFELKFDEVT